MPDHASFQHASFINPIKTELKEAVNSILKVSQHVSCRGLLCAFVGFAVCGAISWDHSKDSSRNRAARRVSQLRTQINHVCISSEYGPRYIHRYDA